MKDFIPYEIALELKELGFDEPCMGYRDGTGYVMIGETPHCVISAPTYSQAFRWFREKYRLTGLVEIGTQEYSFLIFDENTDSREITSSMNGAYEEAELACLIKLIEIVKKK
jgi:hypothetical protein